jgi:hypothetical protein
MNEPHSQDHDHQDHSELRNCQLPARALQSVTAGRFWLIRDRIARVLSWSVRELGPAPCGRPGLQFVAAPLSRSLEAATRFPDKITKIQIAIGPPSFGSAPHSATLI